MKLLAYIRLSCPFIQHTNKSTRRLYFEVDDEWFGDEPCAAFINSPFAAQCEILTIDVKG